MTVSVSQTQSNLMADTLNTAIGANHLLKLFTVGDAELATLTFSGSATVSTVSGAEALTYAFGSYANETNANAGTVNYAVIQTSAAAEVVRFSDPSTELSLSSLVIEAGDDVNATADVVVKLADNT